MLTISLILGLSCSYYYKDYLYNKYLDIVDGYIRVKCSYNKCSKMHNLTHQEYLEKIPLISVYCDGCVNKAFNDFVKQEQAKHKNKIGRAHV